ncbi:MAG: long-chain fatty acid--CoA ligase [Deltaproteobacteria bacterium]|nr:long-chain fatty acid--CoA ligase [Deltaproteobacteria bacterium]
MSDAPANAVFKNLPDLLAQSVARFPDRPRFGTRVGKNEWKWMTYGEWGKAVDDFRAGLASLGVGKGGVVAVIANNSAEWAIGAYATYSLGAFYVPMYEKQNPEDWRFILEDSGAEVLLVAGKHIAKKAGPVVEEIDALKHMVNFRGHADDATSFTSLCAHGAANPVPAADPSPEDLCGLIYTSGTTGNPKGVQLSHGNIVSNVNAMQTLLPMSEDRSLSFLPWAHSFGQTLELHVLTSFGCSSAIVDDVNNLIPYMSEVHPTLLFSVPRIFNKVYDKLNKRAASAPPIRRALMNAAFANAAKRRALAAKGETSGWVETKHGMFDKLVFSKVRDLLGGKLRYAFSGGAAISREVAEFIDNVGITVYEGYGLSETSPVATANYPDNQRIGSVGKAIPGVEIIIDVDAVGGEMGDQGEIIIKGPNIMKGYHGLPEKTAEVVREDGAFRSGDLGRLDADGYLYITGRIKEQYKLENGKYVVPAPLEEQLKLSGHINQAMVFGANKLFNVAVIVPDAEAATEWAASNGVSPDLSSLIKNDAFKALMAAEIARVSANGFKGFERIKHFRLIADEFTTDNDMMTPTLKLKRRNVIKAYQGLLDEMYA